jgi:hypothetical protein
MIRLRDGSMITETTPTTEDARRLRQKIDFALGFVGAAMLKTEDTPGDPPQP